MQGDSTDAMLDAILDEVEALETTMPKREFAELLERRADGMAPGTPGRAAWLSHAGGSWELDGDTERARGPVHDFAGEALEEHGRLELSAAGGRTRHDPRRSIS